MDQIEILFVDDDSFNILLAKRIFKRMEWEEKVFYAENGEEAIRWWKENKSPHFPFLFLDLNMPVMSGMEMLETMEKDGLDLNATQVVLMLSTELKEQTQQASVFRYIKKSIERPLTEAKIRGVIES